MHEETVTPRPAVHESKRAVGVLGLLGGLSAVLVVYFDLGPPLAYNDDWVYAWSVQQLSSGHGLRTLTEQAAVALFHVAWASALTLGHSDQRLLRLTILPLVILGAFSTFKIARRLGSDTFWSVTAALAVSANPIDLALATSFMTDAAYTGLFATACWLGLRWWDSGEAILPCALVMVAATTERQIAVGAAVVLSLAVLLAPSRPVRRRDWVGLIVLWVCLGAAVYVPMKLAQTRTQAVLLSAFGRGDLVNASLAILVLPATAGLFLLPFTAGTRPHLPRLHGLTQVLAAGVVAVVGLLLLVPLTGIYPARGGAFIGDYFTSTGLNPPSLNGYKVRLYPGIVYMPLGVLSVTTALITLTWRTPLSQVDGLARRALFLGALGATQLAVVHVFVLDRYFLPILAPMIPVAAAVASVQSRRLSRAWAAGVMSVFIGLYVVGEQDYQAWQQARDVAERRAISIVAASRVNGGYEANGIHLYVPLQEHDPSSPLIPHFTADSNPELAGPPHPCIRLEFAAPGDHRSGVDYRSLASGRVILAQLIRPCPAE